MCTCATADECGFCGPVRANTERSEEARSAHVPPGVSSHARADLGDAEFAMRLALRGLQDMERRGPDKALDVDGALEDARFHDAVSAELVACTLGQRRHADRLELRTDLTGKVMHAVASLRIALRRAGAVSG